MILKFESVMMLNVMIKSASATEISYDGNCTGITGECAGNLVCEGDTDTCLCSDETNEYHKGHNVCETSK